MLGIISIVSFHLYCIVLYLNGASGQLCTAIVNQDHLSDFYNAHMESVG